MITRRGWFARIAGALGAIGVAKVLPAETPKCPIAINYWSGQDFVYSESELELFRRGEAHTHSLPELSPFGHDHSIYFDPTASRIID